MFRKLCSIGAAFGVCASSSAIPPRPVPIKPDFAINLYHELAKGDGNVFFSPISIQSALAMTSEGARGETAKQMAGVIQIGDSKAFSQMLSEIQRAPVKDQPRMTLTIANAIWAQEAYPFDPAYVALVRKQFAAEARGLDFAQSEASRQIINKWVEDKTNNKIKDLIAQGMITQDTRMVLTNAVYFNADWASQFKDYATTDAPFMLSDPEAGGKSKTVKMMRQVNKYGYADARTHHVVSLRYAGSDQAMVLMVPKKVNGLAKVEASLTPASLSKALSGLASRKIDLSMPRFKIEQSAALGDVLKKMGMELPFDGEKADFSGMTTAEKLSISAVVHKAFCKVDENGTEAAAATAVLMEATSAPPMEEEKPLEIRADRPFLFAIVDLSSQAVLFMGRVADPGE